MNLFLVLAAAIAGVAASFQGAANAGLSSRAGLGPALIVNTTVVLLCAFAFFFATRATATFFPAGTPWCFYIGASVDSPSSSPPLLCSRQSVLEPGRPC